MYLFPSLQHGEMQYYSSAHYSALISYCGLWCCGGVLSSPLPVIKAADR